MKLKFNIFFLILLIFISFTNKIYANNYETIISTIQIEEDTLYDIELLLCDEKIYIPFKSFSEIFETKIKINHTNHNIDFEYQNKKGTIGSNFIKYNNKTISNKKNFYVKFGLMDETKDEIFCNEKDLEKIFKTEITTNINDLTISIISNKDKDKDKEKENKKEENLKKDLFSENKIKAYKNVISPLETKKITLEAITLNNNTISDAIKQYNETQTSSNVFFNNNSKIGIIGKAFDGEYKIDLNTYSYKDSLFNFGGIGVNYKNKYKNFEYELGKPKGIIKDDYSIASQLFGLQIRNYSSKKENYKDICGKVDKESLVKVYLDDKEFKTLNTYDGYYSLFDLSSNKNPKKIKITELKNNKEEKTILEKKLKNPDVLDKKEKHYDIIAGVSGYNNRLFTQNNYIYKLNTKKFLLGGNYVYQFDDNSKLDSSVFIDKIYSKPKNSFWRNIYSLDALLTSGTYKNPNNYSGVSNFNAIYFKKNDLLNHKLQIGESFSRDYTRKDSLKSGYSLSFETNYKAKKFDLRTEIFNISPDFYLAGSDGGYINDRLGASIGINRNNPNFSFSIQYKKYLSNLKKEFDGGYISFDEYNLSLNKNFKKYANLKFNINGRQGENSYATNKNYYYTLAYSKHFTPRLNFEIGQRKSMYNSKYSEIVNNSNDFKSIHSSVYIDTQYKLPKNLGKIKLGHENVNYTYSNLENKYNIAKIGYTFPEFKNMTLSLETGYKYKGQDNGFDFGVNLALRTKSGRIVNINYQYNKTGGYIINNMFMPMNDRHSINITLNDAFAFLPNKIKSIGNLNPNQGYAEIISYIDKNKNGKLDKKDIRIKNVPIKCSWVQDNVYTNRKGVVCPNGIDKGIYTVEINTDNLPITLFQEKTEKNKKMIRIDAKKTTRIEFPLKSCIGNIEGKLNIKDDFNRNLNVEDFVVVLLNENKEEVKYSTVDKDGYYYISGIEPGKYYVQMDENMMEENSIKSKSKNNYIEINIPFKYKKILELKNINLNYQTESI